jgi:peptidoglycan/LPS O-acetylase OafA/YrhL
MPGLIAIRFPLAIWVVVHHLSGPGNMLHSLTASIPVVQALVGSAWVALGVFFAISGFVLTLRYRTQHWTGVALTRYSVARLARVYPLYLLSLLIVGPIIAQAISSGEVGGPATSAGVLLNYALLLQGWERPPVDWNTPAWSLSCELFFYACFPAIILVLRRLNWRRVLSVMLFAFAVAITVRAFEVPTTIKPFMYAGDFLAGVGAAGIHQILVRRGWGLSGRGYRLWAPAVAGSILLLSMQAQVPFILLDNMLRVALVLLILGLAFGSTALSSPLFMWGGRASYAIYILHIPILWWYKRSTPYLSWPPVDAALLYLALVVAISLVVCRWLEQPAEAYFRRLANLDTRPVSLRRTHAAIAHEPITTIAERS